MTIVHGEDDVMMNLSSPILPVPSLLFASSPTLRTRSPCRPAVNSYTSPASPLLSFSLTCISQPHARPAKITSTRNPRLQCRPPSPLQHHALIVLGRCLPLCRKHAVAEAARLRSRQLRGDGEMGCCVRCTWLVTLFLNRLLRIA